MAGGATGSNTFYGIEMVYQCVSARLKLPAEDYRFARSRHKRVNCPRVQEFSPVSKIEIWGSQSCIWKKF